MPAPTAVVAAEMRSEYSSGASTTTQNCRNDMQHVASTTANKAAASMSSRVFQLDARRGGNASNAIAAIAAPIDGSSDAVVADDDGDDDGGGGATFNDVVADTATLSRSLFLELRANLV